MRGNDGDVRAFHNVCRHRAARLLDGPRGSCTRRIVCPYHAWSYDFEGRLASVGDRSAFPHLDIARESLVPVEMEIYAGLRVRAARGRRPERRADDGALRGRDRARTSSRSCEPIGRVDAAAAQRELEERRRQLLRRAAHPGRASGAHAAVRRHLPRRVARVDRPHGRATSPTSRRATGRSARTRSTCPPRNTCPADKRRSWVYFKLWPNFAFDVYPDQVDIMQWLPISPTQTLIREIGYARPDDAPRDARRALLQLAHQPPGE